MIKIICIGKLKEKYLIDAVLEYSKRIKKYTKIEIIELPDETDHILEKECCSILKHIPKKSYIITLEIEGKQFTSEEFAQKIDQVFLSYSDIVFIIGGSNGLHEKIKEKSNFALSFSKMTFPHQLFRVILLEQIYRCFKINHHETYHK